MPADSMLWSACVVAPDRDLREKADKTFLALKLEMADIDRAFEA